MFDQSRASASKVFFAGKSFKNSDDRNMGLLLEASRRKLAWTRNFVWLAMAFMILGAFAMSAKAQTLALNWAQQSPANSPPPRYIHAMAYDAAHGQVIVFGGFSLGGDANDTWLWDGTNWTQASPVNSPSPRDGAAMVYDAAHGQVVLFGGESGSTRLGDTWLWDGSNWTQANPANSPAPRNAHAMAYDAAHGQAVLFGGVGSSGFDLNDTWAWNGTNWTQQAPANSPSARAAHSMAYDAATGQVVLFGGSDSGGNYVSDTWVWNGTNWTQQNPANSPPARYSQAMAYDAALGQVVMFGGYNGNYLNDTWVYDGVTWTQDITAASPSGGDLLNAIVYDAAHSQIVQFGGYNGSQYNATWEFGLPGNFGNVNVCPSGQSTPAPCSSTVAFTYNVATPTTFGTPQVVTQGTGGLDFALGSGSTCTGTAAPGTCTVNLTFTPQLPGLRTGAIQLVDNGGSILATTPIYGNGQGPAVAFGPGVQTTVGSGLNQPQGVAVDAAGDVFIANFGSNQVFKVAPGGAQSVISATGLANPFGVAVDGAGNVIIADPNNHRVVKVTPAGVQTTVGSVTIPYGVAADGAGNVFIVDSEISAVVKVTPAGVQTTLPFTGLVNPYYVAVDAAGNVFVNDATNIGVFKLTPAGVQTTVPATGLVCPYGVAVDAAGDVFIADPCQGAVVEVTPSGVQSSITGLGSPISIAVDGTGNIFTGNESVAGTVIELARSQPPTLNFDTAYVGNFSDDSPKSVTVQNVGNQTLSHSAPGLIVAGSPYSQTFGATQLADCTSTFSLAPGGECDLSISFRPTSQGTFGSVTVFTDNALNVSGAQQVIYLYGSGLNQTQSLTVSGAGSGNGSITSNPTGINCSEFAGASSGACSANFVGGQIVLLQEVPSAGSTFAGWGGACASYAQNQVCQVTLNSASSAIATFSLNNNFAVSVTTLGSGSGTVNDSQQIQCVDINGASSGICSGLYASGSLVTLVADAQTGSQFTGWGGACASSGTNPICSVTVNQALNATASFVNQSFGSVNVCPAGQNSPAPCSTTLPLTFNLSADTTIGITRIVTQGSTGLDFNPGAGSTCTGTITAGNSCTVNVNFAPLAAGLRMGAVQLFDNSGNLVASLPIYGIGREPEIAFGPGVQSIVNTTANYPLNQPKGVTVDAAGDVFIADNANQRVVKVAANGIVSTVGSGLNYPQGLAVDGAGDLFIADNNLNEVVEVPAGCTTAACQTTVGVGLSAQLGVAVDGAGDVFIASFTGHEVVEVPAGCTSSACQIAVYSPGPNSEPVGVAADAAGDVFVADFGLASVVEIPAGCTNSNCQLQVGQGWIQPVAVAVDAAGDVYVADEAADDIVEVLPGCTSSSCEIPVMSGILSVAVAVDGQGNIFVPENNANQVVKINRSQPTALSFALTNVGSTSADSPQSFTVQNIGNQPLTGSLALNLGASFTQNATSSCSATFSLAPGAICGESFSFTPQSASYFAGTAVFADNSLNVSPSTQTIALSGIGAIGGQAGTVAVPDVVGQAQAAASTPLTGVGLVLGTVTAASSSTVPSGSVISENPAAGTQVAIGSVVNLLVSSGIAQPPSPNPLLLENNYFVTGDYVSAGVTLRGTGSGGVATGTITIPTYAQSATQGVPDGADIVEAFLYWETVENTPSASAASGTFNNYAIVGQQIGNDIPNYTDGAFTGTLRAYRADVNTYLPVGANGVRFASGAYKISLPDGGSTGLPLTEGASLVLIYRVLSPNFPLKSVVIYDGSALPVAPTTQVVQGFYDAVGGASGTGKNTNLFASGGQWNNSVNTAATLGQSNQYSATLNPPGAYAAVILSTPVNNSDNDGILDAWKAGPAAGDFHAGQPGYYDVKTGSWVSLPGAKHGQKDLFVQLDYMCGVVLADGSCDPTKENLFPSPDASGNDPLAMVQKAFAATGVQLHLQIGNAIPEDTCTDSSSALCQFPNQPGVIGWKNSLEFSKLWPRNLTACATGGDCMARFPYGQKDSYHYVLFGHSLAIPAWNTRYGTLTSIHVVSGVTTIATADRGTGINACPSRITISGVLGNPSLNGVYNTTGCADTKTISITTPGVPNWSYPNSTLAEPVIGLTSGTITSISGYSDLGGADSAVTLGLWLTAPHQDMSKRANVLAGTLFHEIGHTLGLSHGGLYYDTPASYVPTFDANCKPNYQSVMNYLFQLDLLGPNQAVAFSNQALLTLNENTAGSVTQLIDGSNNAATYPTSAWYVPYTTGSLASPATLHCDGTPLNGEAGYRVDSSIAPIAPAWANGQDLSFLGALQPAERGYNDVSNMDLRQVGATGGEFASLANVLSFGNSAAPLNISAGGNIALGSGGTVTLGSGGTVTLGSGGNVTLGSGGTITLGSGGNVTLGSGGNVTLGSGGTVTPGSSGTVTLGSGGNVTLGSGGTITLGSGGTIALGSGGNVTLGSGGTIALGSGGTVTIPSTGGSYAIDGNGGTITLGSGGNVTLGSGGNVTLGSGGVIALGSGGNVTLGSGGNITLGSGGTIALGSGGNVTLGSGGNVTLGSGGTIALGSGGTVTLGSGGNVTLGSGGTVTLGSGGNLSSSSGGNITLGSGGNVTLGSGGTVTLGSGGNVTLGSGGNVTLGSGGTITLGSGGNVTLGSGGTITLGSGGTVTPTGGSPVVIGAGGSFTFGSSGGTVALGSGGNVTLGSGGNVTLGSGGTIALGSGGTITLGSGGNVTLGSGGVVTLGSGGNVTLGSGGNVTLGSGGTIALGSGGNITLGSGGTLSNELTYDTANSVVRPPTSPTETSTPTGIRIDWNAPAFGVVSTYTIYRSSNGATPIVIGSVSGVNGFAPATEFTDTNPDLTSQTVIYTISTTLAPDPGGAQRQSQPSAPAVLKNDQSITLGPLPSSVTITNPPTVTATAMSSGSPNGLQVIFSASGSCSIGNQSITNNVSSATVALNSTGSCTITASQPGSNAFNAANTVSGTFMVLPQGSNTQSQTINFPTLQNSQYGKTFSFSASSSAGQPVSFTASGPCTTNGTISGVGVCTITASAAGNGTYSAASQTQSFLIFPAVLKVTATNLTSVYGQPLPALTYGFSGFVNNDPTSVVSGTPLLSTTATATSNAGNYPITVSTGTLATANYSFLYVSGTLTVQPANQSALTLITTSPLTYSQSETLSVSGRTTGGTVIYNLTGGACAITGARLTANSGSGVCTVTATMAGNSNYNAVTSTPANIVTLAPASQSITFTTNPPASAAYNSSFTVAATGGGSGNAVTFTSAGACSNSGAIFKMIGGTGTCSVIANQAGNSNYAAAAQVTKTVTVTAPLASISPSSIDFGTVYLGSITTKTITVTNTGTAPLTINQPLLSIVKGGNSNEFVAVNLCLAPLAVGKSCTVTIAFVGGPFYTPQTATLQIMSNAPGSPQPVALSAAVINPMVSFSPTSLSFGTIKHATSSTLNVTLTNPGATPLNFTSAGIHVTGANATNFVQSNNCGGSLAAGAKCTIAVKFTPPATGTFSANLTFVDNAQSGGGTQTVPLSGKGN